MKKKLRKKGIPSNPKNPKNYPYLLTSYNKYYNTHLNIKSNKSHNKTHNKLTININNTFNLYNPDEEYVTKLNFFNIGAMRDYTKKVTLYNLNTLPQFPSIIKKDTDNMESFKEKKRILNELKSKKTMFDKKNNSESSKQTYVNRFENTYKENQLEKERKEIEKKMYKLKEMIKSLSNELSITIKEIDNLKIDVDIMSNYRSYNLFSTPQYTKKISIKIKEKEKDKENNSNTPKQIRKSISKEKELSTEKMKEKEKENKFKMEMMLLSKSEKINKIKQEMKLKIKELEEKKLSLLDKIDVCENELKKFKESHLNLKEELLVHYHTLLSEGKDTRKEGLSWIILAIWNLKSNVLLSYLPKFLDQSIILFLFEYSSLLKKIKDTEKKIQELALKLKEHKENLNLKNSAINNENNIKNIMNEKNDVKNKNEINNNKDKEDKKEKEDNIENDDDEEEQEENNDDEDNNNEDENDNDLNNDDNENNEDTNNEIDKSKSDKKIKDKFKNSNKNIKSKNLKVKEEIEEKNESEISDKENEEKKLINSINNIQEIQENQDEEKDDKKYQDNNQQTKFVETFKTSLYNTNSEKNTKNNNLFFEKDNYKKGNNLKENNFSKKKENKREKELVNINNLPINFAKSLFRKEDLLKGHRGIEDKEKKIKLHDFQNIINTKQSYFVDYETFELFNKHKNMEKYYMQLKENAEQIMKKELDRISKCFYLYDYGAKYNVDQKTVISALIGEDSVRNEYIRQKKQEKEYFKTLKELRNGKMFQKK